MSSIVKTIESIKKLHGDERSQQTKVESYTTWLLRRRAKELDSRTVIKEESK